MNRKNILGTSCLKGGHLSVLLALCVAAPSAIIAEQAHANTSQLAAATGLDANGHLAKVVGQSPKGFSFVRLANGVQISVGETVKNVIFYTDDIVRVNANLGSNSWTAKSLAVVIPPRSSGFKISEDDAKLVLTGSKLRVEILKSTGAVSFFDTTGRHYLSEESQNPQTVVAKKEMGAPTYDATNRFSLADDEAIYGFGFNMSNDSNRRGKDLHLVQTNMGIVIPMMLSTKRYGIMWDTYSQMKFHDGADGTSLWAENAPGGVDYYFMGGHNADEVIADYRELTGQAPMLPKQAFGLFMSKERYGSQQHLLDVATKFRQDKFPLDYIVQDWQYWGGITDGTWSGMIWDPVRYPDPVGMANKVHDLNMKLMVSIWPSIGDNTELGKELDAKGMRFAPRHWISQKAHIYDAFNPEARKIYFKYVKSGLLDKGVDALWMDGTEIEVSSSMHDIAPNIADTKNLGSNYLGDFSRYLNPYSLMTTQGTYEGQRATSDKRIVTLTRSAWAGAQRTSAISWSGDTAASWDVLKQQIADGPNVTAAGNPYWTQDTGGFFVPNFPGGEKNPAWRELFARWLQFATFNPVMRIHGADVNREPYLFKTMDPEVYQSLRSSVELRYRLLPYIYSNAWRVTSEGYTLMRPMMMDFPDDRALDTISDQFMFGPSLLVHPVTKAMYRTPKPAGKTIPSTALTTADGKAGLSVQYFEGENFEKPLGQEFDKDMDYSWPGPPLRELPGGLTGPDHFSARWEGFLTVPEDGAYEVGVESDDGYRLFIDGKKVAVDWTAGPTRSGSATVELKKGKKVPIKIEYFNVNGGRNMRLFWRTPQDLAELKEIESRPVENSVSTYLPKGSAWFDFWTNARFEGGTSPSREAPLDLIPVYVRAGSIVPMGPVMEYTTQSPDAPYEVRVYSGADGHFAIYEDDNETFDYEKGEHATYRLDWQDAARTLRVGKRSGSFPGMIQKREIKVVVIGADGSEQSKTVQYTGQPVSLQF